MDSGRPEPEALVVADGRVAGVGGVAGGMVIERARSGLRRWMRASEPASWKPATTIRTGSHALQPVQAGR